MKFSLMFLVITLAIAGCVQYGPQSASTPAATPVQSPSAQTPAATPTPVATATPASTPSASVIQITASGFSPAELTIKAGETVTWVNKDGVHWPASAAHPTHRVYPGSDIDKCGTAAAQSTFDACKGLTQGETYAFKFDNVGTWAYHDHLNPSLFGKIIVTG